MGDGPRTTVFSKDSNREKAWRFWHRDEAGTNAALHLWSPRQPNQGQLAIACQLAQSGRRLAGGRNGEREPSVRTGLSRDDDEAIMRKPEERDGRCATRLLPSGSTGHSRSAASSVLPNPFHEQLDVAVTSSHGMRNLVCLELMPGLLEPGKNMHM